MALSTVKKLSQSIEDRRTGYFIPMISYTASYIRPFHVSALIAAGYVRFYCIGKEQVLICPAQAKYHSLIRTVEWIFVLLLYFLFNFTLATWFAGLLLLFFEGQPKWYS